MRVKILNRHLWNSDGFCAFNHLSNFFRVFISPPADLEAESEIRRHVSSPDESCVLLHNRFWFRAQEDKEIEQTADGPKCYTRLRHRRHV